MEKYVVLEKRVGDTPLAAMRAWKMKNQIYADVPVSYAGRLDPMASGKLLILLGDECKRQRMYTDLDKEYEIEILLDVGSDTGDALGIPEYSRKETPVDRNALVDSLQKELGAHMRAYPAFSSKTVGGKPLFLYALKGTLASIKIPEHLERIYRIRHAGSYSISCSDLESRVFKFLDRVPRTREPSKRLGEDFRVDTIRTHWTNLFKTAQGKNFTVLRLQITCASGTYMRSLAGRIGASFESNALALSIHRTKIGKYVPIWGGTGFWLRTYASRIEK